MCNCYVVLIVIFLGLFLYKFRLMASENTFFLFGGGGGGENIAVWG